MSSWWLAAWLGCSGAPEVEAQRPSEPMLWALDWEAPAGCPTREQLFEHIRGYLPELEAPPHEVAAARLRVAARVEAGADEWIVYLSVRAERDESTRSFSAANCDELTAAVALVAAVALDPVLVSHELVVMPELSDRAASASEVPAPLLPSSESERELEPDMGMPDERPGASRPEVSRPSLASDLRVGLQLSAGGGFGPTNTSYGAVAGAVAVFAERWRWVLDGGAWLPRTIHEPRAAGRFHGWWVGTRGCVVPNRATIELPLCGGLEAGQIIGVGLPPAVELQRSSYPWLAFSLGGGLNWAIVERVALVGGVSALVPMFMREFVVGEQTLQRAVPIGVRATLGVELRLSGKPRSVRD